MVCKNDNYYYYYWYFMSCVFVIGRLSLSCNDIREVNFENLSILPKLEFLGLFDNMVGEPAVNITIVATAHIA